MLNEKEMSVGERLKQARVTHKPALTQKDVSDRSGVSQSVISDLERGKIQGTTKMIELAASVNVNALWLSSGHGEMRSPETERLTEIQRLSHAVQKLDLTREQVEKLVNMAIAEASKMAFEQQR